VVMSLRAAAVAGLSFLLALPGFASERAVGAEVKHRPDWIVAAVLVILLAIFGAVALAYLGAFQRKSPRSYGWWW